MGLDNGIRLITKQKLDLDDWQIKPEYCKIEFDEFDINEYKNGYYYNVCYWRRHYNLRKDILKILKVGQEGGKYDVVTEKQFRQIQDAIIFYLKYPEEWDDYFALEDCIYGLAQDIIDISWLIEYLKKDKSARVEFYDSF